MVEHVTFLGSKRRESLLGTGARANAYTDFHHTVFHVHAPVRNAITQTDMLPQVRRGLDWPAWTAGSWSTFGVWLGVVVAVMAVSGGGGAREGRVVVRGWAGGREG